MKNMQAVVFDVFCSDSASGNPAAVYALTQWPADAVLQTLAAGQPVPVTAFVVLPPALTEQQPIEIRWFAGRQEINLCGHGSLAAAAYLLSQRPQWQQVQFTSRFGEICVARSSARLAEASGVSERFAMHLPAWPAQRPAALKSMVDSMNLAAQGAVLIDYFATRDLVVVLENAAQVQAYQPDFTRLCQLLPYHAMILTAPLLAANDGHCIGYGLRYFAPSIGIDEDIATGSAQCSLAPYWQERLHLPCLQVQQWSSGGGYFQLQTLNSQQILLQAAVRLRP